MSDLGLASMLPYTAWLPHLLLSGGFFYVIGTRRGLDWLPCLYLVALVLVLHGTPAIDYGTLRYPWAWKHLGVIDYIQRHGALNQADPQLGAYHNWPGFFAAGASIANLAGVRDLSASAKWAPLVFNLLYVVALLMLYRSFTRDHRVMLAAVWIFLTGNWIGQDYFSPQAVAFLFYLILLALCLRFLAPPSPPSGGPRLTTAMAGLAVRSWQGNPRPDVQASDALRGAATAAVLLLIFAIVASHQLTPLAVLSALAALTVVRRLSIGLFAFAVVVEAIWVLFVAAPFVAVALPEEIEAFGVRAASDNLIDISAVSPGQALVSLICRLLTLMIAVAAIAGAARRLALGYRDGLAAALALAPLPLVVVAYGGEIVFRVFLFALPFLGFFAATLFFPSSRKGHSAWTLANAGVFGAVLAVAFVFANNGKDRQYVSTLGDIAAVRWLAETAPEGTLVVEGARVYPSQFRNYERFIHVSIADEPPESRAEILADPVSVLARWLDNDAYHATFIVLTRTQEAYINALGIMPAGAFSRIEDALLKSPRFRLVRASGGSTRIFALNPVVREVGK